MSLHVSCQESTRPSNCRYIQHKVLLLQSKGTWLTELTCRHTLTTIEGICKSKFCHKINYTKILKLLIKKISQNSHRCQEKFLSYQTAARINSTIQQLGKVAVICYFQTLGNEMPVNCSFNSSTQSNTETSDALWKTKVSRLYKILYIYVTYGIHIPRSFTEEECYLKKMPHFILEIVSQTYCHRT